MTLYKFCKLLIYSVQLSYNSTNERRRMWLLLRLILPCLEIYKCNHNFRFLTLLTIVLFVSCTTEVVKYIYIDPTTGEQISPDKLPNYGNNSDKPSDDPENPAEYIRTTSSTSADKPSIRPPSSRVATGWDAN